MRVIAMSDPHGFLPAPATMPDGDLLLIGGDVCPVVDHGVARQRRWLDQEFAHWLGALPYPPERRVWIAGNHDFALELGGPSRSLRSRATYLQDSATEVDGLVIYGSPWSKTIGPWAFSLPEKGGENPLFLAAARREMVAPGAGAAPPRDLGLEVVWQHIPESADIVLVHSPPFGFGDTTLGHESVGSPSLLARLMVVAPRLVVCGHVHEGRGRWRIAWDDETGGEIVNASIIDAGYEPVHDPVIIDL